MSPENFRDVRETGPWPMRPVSSNNFNCSFTRFQATISTLCVTSDTQVYFRMRMLNPSPFVVIHWRDENCNSLAWYSCGSWNFSRAQFEVINPRILF